jgi:Tol biopolymer transport system component
LWELPVDGTEERRGTIESIFARAYTVTRDGIYYVPVPVAGGQASIWFHSFAYGNNAQVTSLSSMALGLTVSPDRNSILIVTASRTGSNVMVVDNFK